MSIVINLKSKRNILGRLKEAKICRAFVDKENENIKNAIEKHNIEKESTKMSDEKFRKQFTI